MTLNVLTETRSHYTPQTKPQWGQSMGTDTMDNGDRYPGSYSLSYFLLAITSHHVGYVYKLFKSLSFPWGLARDSGACVKWLQLSPVGLTSAPREPMGEASRAGHHVGSGRYRSGDTGAHLPFCWSERTNQNRRSV